MILISLVAVSSLIAQEDTEVYGEPPTDQPEAVTPAVDDVMADEEAAAEETEGFQRYGWISLKVGVIKKKPAGEPAFYTIDAPDKIGIGDVIQTAQDGLIEIHFSDENAIILDSFTTVKVLNITPNSFNILVQSGAIYTNLGLVDDMGQRGQARITSPSVEAIAVDGQLKFSYDEFAKINEISVIEGEVEITNKRYPETTITVNEGNSLFIPATMVPQEENLEPLTERDKRKLDAELASIDNLRVPYHAFSIPGYDEEEILLRNQITILETEMGNLQELQKIAEDALAEWRQNPEDSEVMTEMVGKLQELEARSQELSQTLAATEQQAAELEGANAANESSITELRSTLETLRSQNLELEQAKQQLEAGAQSTAAETGTEVPEIVGNPEVVENVKIKQLTEQISSLQRELDQKKARLAELEGSQPDAVAEWDSLLAENDSIRGNNQSQSETIVQLTQQIASLESALATAEAKAADLQGKLDQMTDQSQRLAELESQVQALTDENTQVSSQVDSLNQQIEAKNAQIAELETNASGSAQADELAALKEQVATLTAERDQVQAELANLRSTISGDRDQLGQDLEKLRAELQGERDQYKAERDQLEAELASLRETLNAPIDEVTSLDQELQAARAENASLQQQLAQLTTENGQLQSQLDQRFSTAETMRTDLNSKEQELVTLRAENARLQQRIAVYERQEGAAEPTSGDEVQENYLLQERINEMERIIQSLQQEMDQKIAFYEQKISELAGEERYTVSDIQELQQQIEELTRMRDTYRHEMETLQSRINGLLAMDEAYKELQSAYDSQREDYEALLARFQKLEELDTILRVLQEQVSDLADDDRLHVIFSEEIHFTPGSAELSATELAKIEGIASKLVSYLDQEVNIIVEGRADDRPIRGRLADEYPTNWELSSARAVNVVRVLVEEYGIPPNRMSALARGEHLPLVPNVTTENRQRNRSVRVIVTTPLGE